VLRFALAAAAAVMLTGGCSSTVTGPEILSWQLADGRDCFSAGVNNVELRTSANLATQPLAVATCASGIPPATYTADDVPAAGTLYFDGVDVLGVDLYHGTLSLDDAPPGTGGTRTVTLYAAAAQ
jgi:hypothetical protein